MDDQTPETPKRRGRPPKDRTVIEVLQEIVPVEPPGPNDGYRGTGPAPRATPPELTAPTIIEVRCAIAPDLPGIGATTTLSLSDPPCKAKGVRFDLHRVGVLISYADGSFFGVIPYAQIKRIRFDGRPD